LPDRAAAAAGELAHRVAMRWTLASAAASIAASITPSTMAAVALAACAAGCTGTASFATSPTDVLAVDGQLFWRQQDGTLMASALDGDEVHTIAQPGGAGACASVSEIYATDTGVYWSAVDCTLWRASRDGSDAGPLAARVDHLLNFAVDDANLYSGTSAVTQQPLSGGPPARFETVDQVISAFGVDGDSLVVAAGTSPTASEARDGIWQIDLTSGVDTRLARPDAGFVRTLAVGEHTIAWSTVEGGVFRADLDGGAITRLGDAARGGIEIDGGRIFWASIGDDVVSTALDGSDRRVHYHGSSWLEGPTIADHTLYVLESDATELDHRSLSGPDTYHLVAIPY
jgi:hypothetical protein